MSSSGRVGCFVSRSDATLVRGATLVAVALLLGCGGVERLLPNCAPQSAGGKCSQWPAGKPVQLACRAVTSTPAPPNTSALAFRSDLDGWTGTGVLASGKAIMVNTIAAEHVHPHWSDTQQSRFPARHPAKPPLTELVPLGGDYWHGTDYPIVPEQNGPWVSSAYTADAQGRTTWQSEASVGALWREFVFDKPLLRLWLGGAGSDRSGVGVELWVEPSAWSVGCMDSVGPGGPVRATPPAGFESFKWLATFRGSGAGEGVEPQDFASRPNCGLLGKRALIRIVDDANNAHINVGRLELTDTALPRALASTPVWGFADLHTHPTQHLSFGGLQGIHTVWGSPGGPIDEYVGDNATANLARDLPPCDDPRADYETQDDGRAQFNAHHGGLAAPIMLNSGEGRTSQSFDDLGTPSIATVHDSQGAPTYRNYPDHTHGAHQVHHITQIYREYLGGLRLMSALALQNQGLEYGMGWVICGDQSNPTVDTTPDRVVLRAHVEAMRQLAELNHDWMEIAYTPADARRIIGQNKLAIVLGVELPQLARGDDSPDHSWGTEQVDELYALGIRQVVVVHGMDNDLAGAAVFQNLYNSVNDWMNRDPDLRDHIETMSGALSVASFGDSTAFYKITSAQSPLTAWESSTDALAERLLFRLSTPPRIVLSDMFSRPGGFTYKSRLAGQELQHGILHPLVTTAPVFKYPQGPYDKYGRGHRNVLGLSGRGKEFVARLIQRGMLLDLAHMSDQTVKDTFDLLEGAHCDYPAMISHAHFRRLAIQNDYTDRVGQLLQRTTKIVHADLVAHKPPMSECAHYPARCTKKVVDEVALAREQAPHLGEGTINPQYLPREYDISTAEVTKVAANGGVIGVFLGQGALNDDAIPWPQRTDAWRETNNCAGSSKGFIGALLFAQRHAQGGIPFASDFAMTIALGPRFGKDACSGYQEVGSGSESAAQLLEIGLEPSQYAFDRQRDPVMYTTRATTCAQDTPNPGIDVVVGGKHTSVACGNNVPLEPYTLGERTYDFNVDGLAHLGMVPDMLQDTVNVVRRADPSLPLVAPVFKSAEAYVQMWERARAMAGFDDSDPKHREQPPDAGIAKGACGSGCPKAWNRGAPLQSLGQFFGKCDDGEDISVPLVDQNGSEVRAAPIYQQHRTQIGAPVDLTQQGDWAIFRMGANPVWKCGDERQPLKCPAGTHYVKVRRILDTTAGKPWMLCDQQALPPFNGNREVLFECLTGPHYDATYGAVH